MDTNFSIDILNSSSCDEIGVELWMDQVKFHEDFVDIGTTTLSTKLEQNLSTHKFKIIVKNKLKEHTVRDADGNVIEDPFLQVQNILVDDIAIDDLFTKFATYTHNFNGASENTTHQFFGSLGCNGEVNFEFYTPFYTWLLDNE